MAHSNQINNNETNMDHDNDSNTTFVNEQLPSDKYDRRERRNSAVDSGVASSGSSTPKSTSDQEFHRYVQIIAVSLLFKQIIKRCKSIMNVRGFSKFEQAINELFMSDDELKTQWQKTYDVYWHDRHCHDDERIENEICHCFNALVNDKKGVMIGLDSKSSLKDLLITSMRICSEPNFTLEIRIGLGGTLDPLNLRAPSYAISGVYVLEELLKLREKFSSNQPRLEGNIPTIMLIHPPQLTFFCAWTAAVTINHFDENIAKKNAIDLLSYIQKYIDYFHPHISDYIRYGIDHKTTCENGLLNQIIRHHNSTYDNNIEEVKKKIIQLGKSHGSNEEGSIRYASMHLILAKDIIDKKSPQSILHLLDKNENNLQDDQSICLYNCIITIGGQIEEKFNQLRYAVREAFIKESMKNNEDNYHFPLSIRILSKAGKIPVYYRNEPSDITVDDVIKGRITNLKLTNKAYEKIKVDISILREDIGIHLFKSIWNRIFDTQSKEISSWKDTVSTLVDLFLNVWEKHATDNERECQYLIQNQNPIDQVCEHYHLSDVLNENTRLIIKNILDILESEIGHPFGQTVKDLRRIWKRQIASGTRFHELDDLLDRILLDFVRNEVSVKN